MVSRMWVHGQVPLNLQGAVIKNGGANFHHCWFADSIHVIRAVYVYDHKII